MSFFETGFAICDRFLYGHSTVGHDVDDQAVGNAGDPVSLEAVRRAHRSVERRVVALAEATLDGHQCGPGASDAEKIIFGFTHSNRLLQEAHRHVRIRSTRDDERPHLLDPGTELQPPVANLDCATSDVFEELESTTPLPEVLQRDADQAFELEAPRLRLMKQGNGSREQRDCGSMITAPSCSLPGPRQPLARLRRQHLRLVADLAPVQHSLL